MSLALRLRHSPPHRPMHDQQILFSKPGGLVDYVMAPRLAAADLVALGKAKALLPRDGMVLWALVANWEHNDNTTSYCSLDLAEQLGHDRADVIRSLNRLRRAGLLARWENRSPQSTTLKSRAIISPALVTAGGEGRRNRHQERFTAARSASSQAY